MSALLIKNAKIWDKKGDAVITDILLEERRIVAIEANISAENRKILDAQSHWVIPGLVDVLARTREPGYEHIATILSETKAAVAAGCTTLITPPDTRPIIDSAAAAELVVNRAKKAGAARAYACGALTLGLQGEVLAEMHSLKEAGCVALSNGDMPIVDTRIVFNALNYAATVDLPVILDPMEPWLKNGVSHGGEVAMRYGLAAQAEEGELIGLYRLLALIAKTNVRAIVGPISSARSLELIARAKQEGTQVEAMTSIQHLLFSDIDGAVFNPVARVEPPLRSIRDQQGLRKGVLDGVITIICSDHRPWREDDYHLPFAMMKSGKSTVDTLFMAVAKLAEEMDIGFNRLLPLISSNPAQTLNLDVGKLEVGTKADLCSICLDSRTMLAESDLLSCGKNNPFIGWDLPGSVHWTIKAGEIVYEKQSSKE